MRPTHVEALPFVGAIADTRFQEAETPCGDEKSGTGQGEPSAHLPSWGPPHGPSPCSAHSTASIVAHGRPLNRPIPPGRRSTNQRGAGAGQRRGRARARQPIVAAPCAPLAHRPRAPGGGNRYMKGAWSHGKGRG